MKCKQYITITRGYCNALLPVVAPMQPVAFGAVFKQNRQNLNLTLLQNQCKKEFFSIFLIVPKMVAHLFVYVCVVCVFVCL